MSEEPIRPLSDEELAALDAQYWPFPSFADWPRVVPREDLWDKDHAELEDWASNADPSVLAEGRNLALRTAAFDTGAIERLYPTDRGLTFTVATQVAAWEQQVEERSNQALPLFVAQLEAFEMVLDFVAESLPKITESWIRQLHEVVTAPQDVYIVQTPAGLQEQPLPKGEYKRFPNHVRTENGAHVYAPVEQTPIEMQRLTDEIDSEDFRSAHPVSQAAYVHYALAAVHPFADGNGRVARAVASAFTYRGARVPLLILDHHRDRYFSALAQADKGDPASFIGFIGEVGRDAMAMVTETIKTAQSTQPAEVLSQFRQIYIAQGELSHGQLDEVANGFVGVIGQAIANEVKGLSIPDGVSIGWAEGSGGRPRSPSGFRSLVSPGHRYIELEFGAAPPGEAQVSVVLDVFVSRETDPATSVMVKERGHRDSLVFGQVDLAPEVSSSAEVRLQNFVRRVLGGGLSDLLKASRGKMQSQGY
ncbi:MAG TPA: Fic family protein [Solirubrobacterales bacterium]|jgi:Fic family protein|nr:Fic family protein [Solirubrobacterales bacterium]